MDPLLLFPPEVVHQIWVHLKPKDLLACRAVASHWLESVTSCDEAWFTEFSYDWHEYFEMKKTLRRWSSGKVRRNTFTEVKACVFSEVAFYLLFLDGKLEMRSPSGRLVRVFEEKATDLHKSNNCLMVGVDRLQKPRDHLLHETLVTDFALNEIECLSNVKVTISSTNGFAYYENGEYFLNIVGLKISSNPNEELHFLDTGIVSLENGIVVKTVRHFDAEASNPTFKELRTVASSPRWIPKIVIVPGPRNFFGVIIEQRDFTRFFVYLKSTVVDELDEEGITGFFKEDFFVTTDDIRKSCGFIELVRYEYSLQYLNPQRYDNHYPGMPVYLSDTKFKNIITERWSLFKNCVICCDVADSKSIRIFRKNKKYLSVVKLLNYTNVEFYFDDCILCSTLEKLSPPTKKWMNFEFLPKYAFKIEKPSDFTGNNSLSVNLIHLDL